MTEAEVQKLKSAGIDDAIILDMQKEEANKNGQAAPQAEVKTALPEIDPNTPSQAYSQAQANGVPTEGRSPSMAQNLTEAGAVLAPYAPHALATLAGGYGVYKATQGVNAIGRGLNALESMSETNAMREARLQNRPGFGGTPRPAVPTAPVAPAVAPTPGPVAPAGGVPAVAPTAPAAPVAQAAEAGVMNRAKQVVQQLALSKLAPMAANLAKGANVAALATYSPDLGPAVPQTGRMRGMEINPLTGAPWTREQIAQYHANPAMFDAQLPPPQFRR